VVDQAELLGFGAGPDPAPADPVDRVALHLARLPDPRQELLVAAVDQVLEDRADARVERPVGAHRAREPGGADAVHADAEVLRQRLLEGRKRP